MYVVLVSTWADSWYETFESEDVAKEYYKKAAQYHPEAWLIEGEILQQQKVGQRGQT